MSVHYVYLLHWKKTDMVYVGRSKNFPSRVIEHVRVAYSKSSLRRKTSLSKAIREFGVPGYTLLASTADKEAVKLLELHYIQKYDSCNPARGFNMQLRSV